MMKEYRNQFPLLKNHLDLVYLDAAATALKPLCVLEAEQLYGTHFGTNATRGLYPLAEKTSLFVEETRTEIGQFINCESKEIIFTHGTTDGINMLARSLEETLSEISGEILVHADAHHSHVLPWSELAQRKGWRIKILPMKPSGFIDEEVLLSQVSAETKVIALTLVSNVYGIVNDISTLAKRIKEKYPEVFIIVDAAQAAAHIPLDIKSFRVDALVFSGHKLYGPTGIGILYLSDAWQKKLSPSQFGGGMVVDTSTSKPEWKSGPEKFEAGTLPLAQIFGLRKAVAFLKAIGFENIMKHEQELVTYAIEKLQSALKENVEILGILQSEKKIGLLSFTLSGVHPHDIATVLGEKNICVRAGEHCASFLHRNLSLPATTRISFGVYTTKRDIDTLVEALTKIYKTLHKKS